MKKRNRGQISVYACAMLCVFLMLILTVLQGAGIWEGRAKCNQSVAAAVNSIKGDYQPDLFRRYHILALDKTYYGRGEGYLEERVKEFLEYNLNPERGIYHFNVNEVLLKDTRALTEDELTGYRQQLVDYMKQKLPINVLEALFDKAGDTGTSAEKETLSTELEGMEVLSDNGEFSLNELDAPTAERFRLLGLEDTLASQGITDFGNLTLEDLLELNLTEQGLLPNPQDVMKNFGSMDILYIVMPEQAASVSKESVNLEYTPSSGSVSGSQNTGRNGNIQGISDIMDMLSEESFQEALHHLPREEEELYGIAYALDSFRHYGDAWNERDTMESHVLECETEYILAGQASDYDNLTEIAEELSLIRFVPNAVYAFGDEEMKEAALLLAALILAPVGLEGAAEPVSYIFLACWAYAESLMDVRCLLQEEYVPFIKNRDTWQLSLNGIQNLASKEPCGCEQSKGMNYEEYLAVLLAIMPEPNRKYYRMLDVTQLNIQESIPGFKIDNCIYEFQLQAEIQEGSYTWYLEGEGSYFP